MVQGGSKGSTELGATDYACIIDNGRDGLELIREKMKNMDGLIIAGVNQKSIQACWINIKLSLKELGLLDGLILSG